MSSVCSFLHVDCNDQHEFLVSILCMVFNVTFDNMFSFICMYSVLTCPPRPIGFLIFSVWYDQTIQTTIQAIYKYLLQGIVEIPLTDIPPPQFCADDNLGNIFHCSFTIRSNIQIFVWIVKIRWSRQVPVSSYMLSYHYCV